ncbi:terminal uridylyltransferase Tailor-like [Drosophila bipectinata]|uniref:terminal uridylyltransferase Tailor-like n=1 Tax=Drosophila bipectinata TaxID=42026 RepID=UPI0038B2C838
MGHGNVWEKFLLDVKEADRLKSLSNERVINDLKEGLSVKNIDSTIYEFGSRIVGVANSNSDLDLYVDIANINFISILQPETVRSNHNKIFSAIKWNYSKWAIVDNLSSVSCPIIIAKHKSTGLMCDISSSSPMAVYQNFLVIYLFEIQPIARYMVIYVRAWLKKHGLDGFRSHIIILMVIFFLQIRGKLPAIKKLQDGLSPNLYPFTMHFVNYDLAHFNMSEIPINKKECSDVLFDFFKYYSTFNFSQVAVCCYIGMEKTFKERRFCLPDRFQDTLSHEAADVMIYDFINVAENIAASINGLQLNDLQTKMAQQLQSTFF